MTMKKFLASFGLTCCAALFCASQAMAQNTLPGAPGPEPSIPGDESLISNADLVAEGFFLFDIAQIKKMFVEAGFKFIDESAVSAADNGGVNLNLVVMANDNLVHVLVFQDCDNADCAWLQMINPIPTAQNNIPITFTDINDFNQQMPYGHATLEEEENMAVRLSMKTLPKCDIECIEEQFWSYMNIVVTTHEILLELKKGANVVWNDRPYRNFAAAPAREMLTARAVGHDGLGFDFKKIRQTGNISDLIAWPEAGSKSKFPPLLEPVEGR